MTGGACSDLRHRKKLSGTGRFAHFSSVCLSARSESYRLYLIQVIWVSELKNGTYDLEKKLRFKEWNSFTSFLSFMHFVNFHIVAHKNIAKTLLHLSFILQVRQRLAILMTIELWYLHNLKPNSAIWLKIFQFQAWWWEGWVVMINKVI